MNHLDPLVSQDHLVHTLRTRVPLMAKRLESIETKSTLTHVDLLYLDDELRSVSCAVKGLLFSIDYPNPLTLKPL